MARVQVTQYDKFVADKQVASTFAGITAAAGSRPGFRVERPDPNTLVVVHRFTPGWAVLLAILGIIFLLLGLLFLLVKTEDRVTIIGRDVDGGAFFTLTGQTDTLFAEFLRDFIAESPQPVAA